MFQNGKYGKVYKEIKIIAIEVIMKASKEFKSKRIFLGPKLDFCLTNNEYIHIHVRMKWGNKKYELEDAWEKSSGLECEENEYPFYKSKEFLEKIQKLLNNKDNEYFKTKTEVEI